MAPSQGTRLELAGERIFATTATLDRRLAPAD